MNTEPVAIPGAIMAVITAALALAVGFGLPLTEMQVGLCIGLVAAVIALVTVFQRSRVSPVSTARRAVRTVDLDPPDGTPAI